MKISVFGATGMAGSAIVSEALVRGHELTAISRTARATAQEERVRQLPLDLARAGELDPAFAECDAAVLTVRFPVDEHHRLAPATTRVLDAAARTGTRILVVGGSAPLRSPTDPDRLVIDDPAHVPPQWRSIAQASLDQFHACRRHADADWVYLSPPAVLEPGARTGSYRRGTSQLLTRADGTSRISAADLAIAVLDEFESPGMDRHFTVVHAG
ncbi:NAD(P)-dependent oxidoreductase [Ruania zhangjianzhongii]|uniref:NAD(P)-dependent oxidoreductase n=1 Tax=Ruania zhangjianzhongii TaxID=2603206 RepID=UPI0011C9D189|nr:NAD(P)H-binding protein [Ruania zhangjianzhongii]